MSHVHKDSVSSKYKSILANCMQALTNPSLLNCLMRLQDKSVRGYEPLNLTVEVNLLIARPQLQHKQGVPCLGFVILIPFYVIGSN